MRRKTQDATSITSLAWGKAGASILTPIAPENPSSAPPIQKASIPYELAESTNLVAHIIQDTALFKELGLPQSVAQRRSKNNVASLDKVDHPVKMATKPWSRDQISAALSWEAHRSHIEHTEFVHKEFYDTILKSQ